MFWRGRFTHIVKSHHQHELIQDLCCRGAWPVQRTVGLLLGIENLSANKTVKIIQGLNVHVAAAASHGSRKQQSANDEYVLHAVLRVYCRRLCLHTVDDTYRPVVVDLGSSKYTMPRTAIVVNRSWRKLGREFADSFGSMPTLLNGPRRRIGFITIYNCPRCEARVSLQAMLVCLC